MSDEVVIRFLMFLAAAILRLHRNSDKNGPPLHEKEKFGADAWEAFDEGFARWMGWRGPEEQEREIRNIRR
jgi:hypothetical protein